MEFGSTRWIYGKVSAMFPIVLNVSAHFLVTFFLLDENFKNRDVINLLLPLLKLVHTGISPSLSRSFLAFIVYIQVFIRSI